MFKAGDRLVAVDSELSRSAAVDWHDIHAGIVTIAMPYSGIYYVYFPKDDVIKRLVAVDLVHGKCADAYFDWYKRATTIVEYTVKWRITF